MISTALSHGHPYRLPFENRIFAFQVDEFRRYFPAAVVDHMISAAVKQAARGEEKDNDALVKESEASGKPDRLYPMPPAWDLPVVVAARLSLSFPILFSMVPLHAIDYSMSTHPRKRCWFIDGGLSSNFPMTLFDSPMPRWPTFGIDLTDEHAEHKINDQDPSSGAWMVKDNRSGLSEHWIPFGSDDKSFFPYVGAMLDTIRNWHDNLQMAVPGYRDRIVHVKLRKDEGGLNLNMGTDKVSRLAARGLEAGKQLRMRFGSNGPAQELNWNTHRWIRFKSAVPLLRERLEGVQGGYTYHEPTPAYPDYPALIARTEDVNPKTGEWWKSLKNREAFLEATDTLLHAAQNLAAQPAKPFDEEAPRPVPEMRITPRV